MAFSDFLSKARSDSPIKTLFWNYQSTKKKYYRLTFRAVGMQTKETFTKFSLQLA